MPLNIPNLEKNKTLAPFTTYKIGGPADWFVEAYTIEEVLHAVSEAKHANIPYFLLGCGANILFADKGFRGLVIRNRANKTAFHGKNKVVAESGALIADLITLCYERSLSGFEHFMDIPGTVGGAMWQNLHFLSPDRKRMMFISEIVCGSRVLTEGGNIQTVDVDYFRFGYDTSILHKQKDVVLDVTFHLSQKPKPEIKSVMDSNLEWRKERQPQLAEYPSCGSVFKKIEGIGAGRLIEQADLKGMRIGGAEISRKHANFIVNLGNAKAMDVLALIHYVQKEVKQKFGYALDTEITVVGEM